MPSVRVARFVVYPDPVIPVSPALTSALLRRHVPEETPPAEWPLRDAGLASIPAVVDLCTAVIDALEGANGFAIVRLDATAIDDPHALTVAFWNLFTAFADPLPHSAAGELLYAVTCSPTPEPRRRYYSRSNIGGDIHTDGTYIHPITPRYVALGCLQPATSGGASIVVDGHEVYRRLCADASDAARWLERAYHFDCDDQLGAAQTICRSVVQKTGASPCFHYLREYIVAGHDKAGVPLEAGAVTSFDTLDRLLASPELRHTHKLQRGEMLVLDNHRMLHGREAFADDGNPVRNRMLIRLWGNEPHASVTMIRGDLRGLPPLPETPAGYCVRTWHVGDDIAVPALLGDAFGPDRATYDDLLRFWRRFPGIEPDGVFVVENASGEVVGTATARIDPSSPACGWIHLVAVASGYRRGGLGRLLVIRALHHLAARGVSRALVGTTAANTAAISMYAAIGFAVSS